MEEEKKELPLVDTTLLDELGAACKRATETIIERGTLFGALAVFGLTEAERNAVVLMVGPTLEYVKKEKATEDPANVILAGISLGLTLGKVLQERKGVLH